MIGCSEVFYALKMVSSFSDKTDISLKTMRGEECDYKTEIERRV